MVKRNMQYFVVQKHSTRVSVQQIKCIVHAKDDSCKLVNAIISLTAVKIFHTDPDSTLTVYDFSKLCMCMDILGINNQIPIKPNQIT